MSTIATKCPVCGGQEFRWEMQGCNEAGWRCTTAKRFPKDHAEEGWRYLWALRDGSADLLACEGRPGEPPGYCPQLDREDTVGKVGDILGFLHENEVLYVSNGSMGDSMTREVADWCQKTGYYDQGSIVVYLFEALGKDDEFWREIGEGVVAGKDLRDRCECGALATHMGQAQGVEYARCGACETERLALLEPFS